MAGLIEDGRLNLFFIKDGAYSQTDQDPNYVGYYQSTETSFGIVAEWVCNAKDVKVSVTWIRKSNGESVNEDYPLEATCTRAILLQPANTYDPINIVGIPLRYEGGYLSSFTGAPTPVFRDFSNTYFGSVTAGGLLNEILSFYCHQEKWYHRHVSIETGSLTGNLEVRSVTINKSKIVFIQESTASTRTYTYEITDTFY